MTALQRVVRDGNPRRKFGHVSPHIGKLGPLNPRALDQIAAQAAALLPEVDGETLILGLAESSLFLAWWLAKRLPGPVELRFSTREAGRFARPRGFDEPHSHGPSHFLSIPQGKRYARVLVCEDELTTGATLKNLVMATTDVADRFEAVVLCDMRSASDRAELQAAMQRLEVGLDVIDLAEQAPFKIAPLSLRIPSSASSTRNPFARSETAHARGIEAIEAEWHDFKPDVIYVVGECVDLPLTFWDSLSPSQRPAMQQVTRSPWTVDGLAVRTRQDLGCDRSGVRYYLYNWTAVPPGRALIVCERSTVEVAANLSGVLRAAGCQVSIAEMDLR